MDSKVTKKDDDQLNKNLHKSLWFTSGANFIAALLFFVAYLFSMNIWFLVAAIVLLIAGVGFIFAVKYMENKFNNYIQDLKKKEKNRDGSVL